MTTIDPQKTVFISYRRSTSKYLAGRIYEYLINRGYDAFLDVVTIDSGAFDEIIMRDIAARAHFIVILTPGSLERCQNEGDWLRREIEVAMRLGRNVIPIIEEDFDFNKETNYLPVTIRDTFRRYNTMRLYHEYFEAAMDKLTNRFLKEPVTNVKLLEASVAEQIEKQHREQQLLADFIRNTSHDFRTPIVIIATGLETLPYIKDEEKRNEKITRIRGYVDYLAKLLNQLQNMVVLDSTTQLEMSPTNINILLQNLVLNLQESAAKKHLTLRCELESDLPLIPVNIGAFQEVIDHLLVNAILFTPSSGTIVAYTYSKKNEVILEVRDTGIGISEDELTHIFERFYKADQTRALTTGGAGMGLPIVKRLVELHHGRIEVESVVGEGSTFRIILSMPPVQ